MLSRALLPPGGRVYFDDSENWTVNRTEGLNYNLLQSAVYAIGHALGLSHSRFETSIMFPFLVARENKDTHILGEEDIRNIQALYGPKTNSVSNPN